MLYIPQCSKIFPGWRHSLARPTSSCFTRLAYGSLHEASTALLPSGCPLCRRHLVSQREREESNECCGAVAVTARLPHCDICVLSAKVVMRGVGLMERDKDYNNAFHYLEILLQVSSTAVCFPFLYSVRWRLGGVKLGLSGKQLFLLLLWILGMFLFVGGSYPNLLASWHRCYLWRMTGVGWPYRRAVEGVRDGLV